MPYKKIKKYGRFQGHRDFSNLESNSYVQKWVENVKSKRSRFSMLNDFCEFLNKTPNELIDEHYNDAYKRDDPRKIENIAKKQLKAFFGYLTGTNDVLWKNTLNNKIKPEDLRISWNSARQYCYSKLASFYKRNNVAINWQKDEGPEVRKDKKDKVWRNGEERISIDKRKECLKQICNSFESIRDRSILLCKISSGMDDVDLFKLIIKDYIRGIYPSGVCYITGVRQKISRKGIRFQTFFNSEACDMINLYLKERKSKEGELDENDLLFVTKNKSNGEYIGIKKHFADNLKGVCRKLNINNITPKSIRRWFKTELSKQKVRVEFIKRMMGHAVDVEGTSYEGTFDDPDEFEKEYVENIVQFTLLGNGNQKLSEVDKRVEKIEKQNRNLIKQLADTNERLDNLEKYLISENVNKSEFKGMMAGTIMDKYKDIIPTEEEEKELERQIKKEQVNK